MPTEARRRVRLPAGTIARRFAIATAAVASSLLATHTALAADRYWVAGSGLWDVPGAWSATAGGAGGAGVPANGDNAFVFSSGSLTLTRDNTSVSYVPPGLNRLDLAGSGGLPVTVAQSANQMIAVTENIGTGGFGKYNESGGTNSVTNLNLGTGTLGTGIYNLSGGTLAATSIALGGIAGDAGSLNVIGGTLSATTLLVGTNGTGTCNITGGTLSITALTVGGNGVGTFIQSAGQTTIGTLNVFRGSTFTSTSGSLATNGAVTVDAATFSIASALVLISGSPSLTVKDAGLVSIPNSGVLLDGTMSLQSDGVLNASLDVSMFNSNDRISLDGGRLSASTIGLNGGTVIFNSGTLNLTGSSGLSVFAGGVVGNAIDLTATRSLEINNTTTLVNNLSTVTLDGGTFSTGTLAGSGFVVFNSGTFRLTASDLDIGSTGPFGNTFDVTPAMHLQVTGASNKAIIDPGALLYMPGGSLSATTITNNGEIQLASGATRIAGGTLTNNGLIDGSGRIDNALVNSPTGTLRAGTPDHLVFTAANNTTSGTIQLLGGIAEFQQNLSNSGTISGHGSLIATGGWTNSASITLTGGPADVLGAGTNTSTAHVLVTGGANATFYNAVTNQTGSVFKVSTDSVATFLGPVSGLAAFTGAGTTIFESTTSPGPLAAGTSIVESTGNLSATSIQQPALIVRGNASIVPNGTSAATSVLQTLSIDGSTDAWNGKLDLANNHLVVTTRGATPIATIPTQIKNGFAGNWAGNGITSSSAHAVAVDGSNPHKTGLGYADASSLGVGSFAGQSVDSTAVLVGYAYLGDTNLDGVVNALDFNALATHFGANSGALWDEGDFNYDGVVNTADFTALAANFSLTLAGSSVAGSVVPEPAALLLVPLAFYINRPRRNRGSGLRIVR